MNEKLTDDNFLIFAIKHYDNPHCQGMKEFQDDLRIFGYITRLFARFAETGEIKERLILNHIITLCNLFGVDAGVKLLRFKSKPEHLSFLNTFLLYLNYLPPATIDGTIVIDANIIKVLRAL